MNTTQWTEENAARKARFVAGLGPLVCAVCEQTHADYPALVIARWQDKDICTDCLEQRPGKEEAEAEARGERHPLTQQEYREAGGSCCPRCRSWDVVGKGFDTEEGIVSQRVTCQDCEHQWTDFYRLAGYVRETPAGARDFTAFLCTAIVETPAA